MKKILFIILVIMCYSIQANIPIQNVQINIDKSQNKNITIAQSNQQLALCYVAIEDLTNNLSLTISNDGGATWSKPSKIISSTIAPKNPYINAAGKKLVLVWEDRNSVYYAQSSDWGTNWTAPIKISEKFSDSHTPKIYSAKSIITIAWHNAGNIFIKYYDTQSQTWSQIFNVSRTADMTHNFSVDIDNTTIHLCWHENNQIKYAAFTAFHDSLSNVYTIRKQLTGINGKSSHPVIAVMPGNEVNIIFVNDEKVLHVIKKAQTWQKKEIMSNVTMIGNIKKDNEGKISCVVKQDDKLKIVYINHAKNIESQKDIHTLLAGNEILSTSRAYLNNTWKHFIIAKNISDQKTKLLSSTDTTTVTEKQPITTSKTPEHQNPRTPELTSRPPTPTITPPTSQLGTKFSIISIHDRDPAIYSKDKTIYFSDNTEEKQITIAGKYTGQTPLRSLTVAGAGYKQKTITNPPQDWSISETINTQMINSTIEIKAVDAKGNTYQESIQIIKDTTPPEVPQEIAIDTHDTNPNFPPNYTALNSFKIKWKGSNDHESGIKNYHVGFHKEWWKNKTAQSGIELVGSDGKNTVYVFAMDNVGNVSIAGTQYIMVDIQPPTYPTLAEYTSKNYVVGSKVKDTKKIEVNGSTEHVEILSDTTWRWFHGLESEQKMELTIQGYDAVGNKSQMRKQSLYVDKTLPVIEKISFSPNPVHHSGTDIEFSIQTNEPTNVYITVPGYMHNILLEEKSAHKRGDYLYHKKYAIDKPFIKEEVIFPIITVFDKAGNTVKVKSPKPITITPLSYISIDNGDEQGRGANWHKFMKAKNIKTDGQKNNIIKIDYTLENNQSWAAMYRKLKKPINAFGNNPAIEFQCKGSNDPYSSIAIKLLSDKNPKWNKTYQWQRGNNYDVPLMNTQWHKITVPINHLTADELKNITHYAVIIYSLNEKAKGTVYLDTIGIRYNTTIYSGHFTAPNVITVENPIYPKPKPIPKTYTSAFDTAPYLEAYVSPYPITSGKKIIGKIKPPKNVHIKKAYVEYQSQQGKKQFTLTGTNAGWLKTKEIIITKNPGNYLITYYLIDRNNNVYRKTVPFEVVTTTSTNPLKTVKVMCYPHPIYPGKGTNIITKIPSSIKVKSAVIDITLNDSSVSKVLDNKMKIKEYSKYESPIVIPANTKKGIYTGKLTVLTISGKRYSKEFIIEIIK
ncbi:sialidase family protein [Candidatus Margulisiibacteriota bacterium]